MRGKQSLKRSKTFTGCWTCRSRSIKCGQEKPTCLRCRKSSRECTGYGVGLVWPADNEPRRVQRRQLLDRSLTSHPAFNCQTVGTALKAIDSVQDGLSLTVGLFSVFPSTAPDGLSSPAEYRCLMDGDAVTARLFPLRDEETSSRGICARSLNAVIHPFDYCPPAISSTQDRQLMYYWITCLSVLMTPTLRVDNAFKDIFTPMAMSATIMSSESPGHLALLHSLYAVSAFSRACTLAASKSERSLGIMNVQKSLRHLKQSLMASDLEQQQATLAAITILTIVPCFAGGGSDWRIHIRGGSDWLRFIDGAAWMGSPSAVTLYQLFVCLEALRPAHSAVAQDLEPQRFSLEHRELRSGPADRFNEDDIDWHLDSIWGITKPLMRIIVQINQLVFAGKKLSTEELNCLELKIYRSNPSALQFSGPTKECEYMTRCQASAFYYACHIYFSRALQKLSPRSIQHLVRQCLEHIEAANDLEVELNLSGLFWPGFIAACEAEDADLRLRATRYIDRREQRLGLSNVAIAKRVVLTVWNRRDKADEDGARRIYWYDIMAELGIDILLS